MPTIGKYKKVIFSEDEIQFLKENFHSMTNEEMIQKLNCTLTVLKNKKNQLGLKKMNLEYWTPEQIQYLKNHYKQKGNKELVKDFTDRWHKEKGWHHRHMTKKMMQLGLYRNKQDLFNITERNRQQGCFGKPNPKKKLKPMPKVYFMLDNKTRIEVKPGQEVSDLKLKYENRNLHLLKNLK